MLQILATLKGNDDPAGNIVPPNMVVGSGCGASVDCSTFEGKEEEAFEDAEEDGNSGDNDFGKESCQDDGALKPFDSERDMEDDDGEEASSSDIDDTRSAVGEGKREIEVGKAVIEDYHDLGCSPILLDHATREKDLQHMEIHESTGDAKAAHRVFDNTPQPLTLTSMLTHPSSSSINKQFVDLSNNGGIEKKASSGGDLAQSVVKVQGGIKASGDKKINGRQSGLGQGVRV
ncbi:hypothetical protein U1Q18_028089 [Sarracenia purpurea var. burkii]